MSERIYARPVFDRKKGFGKVEILVTLSRREKKYYAVCKCTALEWVAYKATPEFEMKVAMLNDVALGIVKLGEPMTIANFEAHLNLTDLKSDKRKKKDALSSPTGFLDFMRECIKKEKNAPKTLSRKEQVIRYLEDFGRIKRFCDVHEYNLIKFNEWLDDGSLRPKRAKVLKTIALKAIILLPFQGDVYYAYPIPQGDALGYGLIGLSGRLHTNS